MPSLPVLKSKVVAIIVLVVVSVTCIYFWGDGNSCPGSPPPAPAILPSPNDADVKQFQMPRASQVRTACNPSPVDASWHHTGSTACVKPCERRTSSK